MTFTDARPELNKIEQSLFNEKIEVLRGKILDEIASYRVSSVYIFPQLRLDFSFYVFFARGVDVSSISKESIKNIEDEITKCISETFPDVKAKILFNVFLDSVDTVENEFNGSFHEFFRAR